MGSKYRVHLCIVVVAFLLETNPSKAFESQKPSIFDFNFFNSSEHRWRCLGLRGSKEALIFRRGKIICYSNCFIAAKDVDWASI